MIGTGFWDILSSLPHIASTSVVVVVFTIINCKSIALTETKAVVFPVIGCL